MTKSIVTYNGVEMFGVKTLDFQEELIYDPSGTDLVRHRYYIVVEGFVHDQEVDAAPMGVTVEGGGGGSAATFVEIERLLGHPRGNFIYDSGGVLLEANSETDVDNGPKPDRVNIIRVVNGRTYQIRFSIAVSIVKCDSGNEPAVLSNRWSVNDSTDETRHTTRTVQGRLRVRSSQVDPQDYRNLCIPGLPQGYKRIHLAFTTAANGLELDYTIVDASMDAAPPWPAVAWGGNHSVSTSLGVMHDSRVHVWLKGDPNVNKRLLLGTAIRVIESRIGALNEIFSENGNGVIPKNITVSENLDENYVEMTAEIRHTQSRAATEAMGLVDDKFCRPLDLVGHDPKRMIEPRTFEPDSPTGAFRMFLQSPCNDDSSHAMEVSSDGQYDTVSVQQASTSVSESQSDGELPSYEPNYSDAQYVHAYTFYELTSKYTRHPGRIALPIASELDSQSNEDTVRIIQLHNGVQRREVHVKAERVGEWPSLPGYKDMTSGDVKHYLMKDEILAYARDLLPDGRQYLHRVEAKFYYTLARPLKPDTLFPVGALPYTTDHPESTDAAKLNTIQENPDVLVV